MKKLYVYSHVHEPERLIESLVSYKVQGDGTLRLKLFLLVSNTIERLTYVGEVL